MITKSAKLRLALSTTLASGLLFAAAPAWAQASLPDLGHVTDVNAGLGGTPGVTAPVFTSTPTPTGTDVRVDLRNNRTILTWGGTGFNLAAGNSVNFKDARATSGVTNRVDNIAVLNRDVSGDTSYIFGAIRSDPNVAVYIVSRGGIYFGPGASVDTGALFASGSDITDDSAFLGGSSTLRFGTTHGNYYSVGIEGATIHTAATSSTNGGRMGDVVLIGATVNVGTNATINADGGDVGLIAASDVTVTNAPGSPLSFTVNASATDPWGLLGVGGHVTGRNVTLAAFPIGDASPYHMLVSGTVTATGASQTDRGIVLSAGAASEGLSFPSGVTPFGSYSVSGSLVSAKNIYLTTRQPSHISGTVNAAGLVDLSTALPGDSQTTGQASVTGGSIAIHGGGNWYGLLKTTSGNLTFDTGSYFTFSNLAVAGDLIGTAGTINVGNVDVGGNISVTTDNSQSWQGTIKAHGSISLTATDPTLTSGGGAGIAVYGSLSTDVGDITIKAQGTADLEGVVSAGGKLDVQGDYGIWLANGSGTHGVKLVTGASHADGKGVLTLGSYSALGADADLTIEAVRIQKISDIGHSTTNLDLQAGRDISVTVTDLTRPVFALGTVTAGRNVTITSPAIGATRIEGTSGSVTLTAYAVPQVNSSGFITVPNIVAGTNITVSGGGQTMITNLSAGLGDIRVTTSAGNILLGGSTTSAGTISAGGSFTMDAGGTAQLRANVTAGGDIAVSGNSVTLGVSDVSPALIKAKGAITVTSRTATISANLGTTIQSNSDGIGSEPITIQAATTAGLNNATLLGGTNRQSDIQIRNPANSALAFGVISARSLLGASGSDPFTNGITRNATVALRGAISLTNSLFIQATGMNITGASVTVANGDIDLRTGAALNISGAFSAPGDVNLQTSSGNITVTAAGSITGHSVILSTPAAFINQRGADAVTITSGGFGHWVIYSADPAGNTFGNLDSGNSAYWNSTLATRAPDTITGNRYVFALAPTLTFTPVDTSKVYGTDLTGVSGFGLDQLFAVTGYQPGVAGAFRTDTAATAYMNLPTIISNGLARRATVLGGPYALTLAANPSLVSNTGYAIVIDNSSNAKITVTPRPLDIGYVANNREYDGTRAGTGQVVIGNVISGDDVTASGTTWTFADKNAGLGKIVTVAGTTLSGADLSNYSYTLSSDTVMANITKRGINILINGHDKTYDGTTDAPGSFWTSLGIVSGDDVAINGGTLAFTSKNASGNAIVALIGALSLSGADSANYALGSTTAGHATISPKLVTGSVTVNNKIYDGTRTGSGSILLSGVIGNDVVGTTGSVYTFADRNAGSGKAVTVSGTTLNGADAGNYELVPLTTNLMADIFKKVLTATYTANSKTYDGTAGTTGSVLLTGTVSGDDVGTTGSVFAFADKNAGNGKTVTLSGTTLTGADAANYSFTVSGTAMADILKKALTGTITANNKTYDGTTAGSGTVALNGVVQGDTVGTAGSVWTFSDKNAGAGKTVTLTGTSLSGIDAGNYTLTLPATALADILKKALTGTFTANSKTYDGTTGATGSVLLTGAVSGDDVGTTGSVFSFADKNAGNGKAVTVSGTMLSGADAANYSFTLSGTAAADILKKALTATLTANNKTYDGTTSATGTVALNGVVQGDTVGTTGSVWTFSDKNAGTGKTVSLAGTALSGGDAGNYTLTLPATAMADILKKALIGTITANSKTYDGTTTGSGTVALGGVVQGDTVGTSGSVWTFSDKNAGAGKTVTLTGTSLSGADAGNYTLTLPATAMADILKKALTGTVTITTRTYDGTTNANGAVTLSGVVQGDAVGTTGSTFAFADKNAGTGKTVIVNGTTLTGADAANYTLSLSAAMGDILKKAITGTATANNKTYDGTTASSGTVTLSGVLQGDTVGTTGTAWTFADKNAGVGKTVTITGTTLNGADAGNYTLTLPASALADILKKSITGTVTITARQYDGTTTATGTIGLSGVIAGDTVSTSGTVLTYADKNAGTGKTVTVGGTTALTGADAGNYTLTMPASVLGDILKRSVAVTADDKSKNRNDDDPLLTFSITSGSLVSGDAFSGSLTRAAGEAPGSYAITIGSLALGSNYTLSFSPGTLTIVLNPAENQPQILKTIPLPSQLIVPAAPATDVAIDKDALCGEDATCVAQ